MKKQFKLAASAVLVAVAASASFAASFNVVDLADSSADLGTYHGLGNTEMNIGFGTSSAVENVALIGQSGDHNIGYISQLGAGNFAVITQTNSTVANAAYVSQTGDKNRAVINQR